MSRIARNRWEQLIEEGLGSLFEDFRGYKISKKRRGRHDGLSLHHLTLRSVVQAPLDLHFLELCGHRAGLIQLTA